MATELYSRNDGWNNLWSNIGIKNKDKNESTTFGADCLLDDSMLSALFNSDGLGAKIITIIPKDATRAGWKIEGDEEEKIAIEARRLKVKQKFVQALSYARLYGGAIIVMFTDRGELDKPLSSNVGTIKHLKVYSSARIQLMSTDIVTDVNSPYFEDVEFFPVMLRNGTIMRAHRSRCLVFKGEMSSDYDELDFRELYWGLSAFQRIWGRLKNYAISENAIPTILQEFIIGKYKLSNLASLLSQNTPESLETIYSRIDIINTAKSIINAVLLAEDEDYTRDSANVSGIPELLTKLASSLSAVSYIPIYKLFGESLSGFNTTGENETRNYYDTVSEAQDKFEPELQRIINIIGSYVYGGKKVYPIGFNSLWEPTAKQKAEIDEIVSTTQDRDINNGTIDAEEARIMRYPDLAEKDLTGGSEEDIVLE